MVAKEKRNSKTSGYGRSVVDLEKGLHVLLQDMATKLFDIEAQVVRYPQEDSIKADTVLLLRKKAVSWAPSVGA